MGTALVRRARKHVTVLAVMAGLLGSGAMVWQGSQAAFTATTANAGNSWSSGQVVLGDDDSNAALFATLTGLKPGAGATGTGTKCIKVTYTGNLATTVKLYTTAASYAGTLGTYLDMVIDEGSTVGDFSTCTGFVVSNNIYTGTLANFASTKTSHANGVGTWGPSVNPTVMVYRFKWTLQDTDSAQNKTAGIGFTFEAQST